MFDLALLLSTRNNALYNHQGRNWNKSFLQKNKDFDSSGNWKEVRGNNGGVFVFVQELHGVALQQT